MSGVAKVVAFMQRSWWRAALVFAVLAVAFVVFGRYAVPPSTALTSGALALELVGTRSGAVAVLRAFEQQHSVHAAWVSITWDFAFIASYVAVLVLALRYFARPGEPDLIDRTAAKSAVLAGAADCLENLGMLAMLAASPQQPPDWLGFAAFATTVASLVKWVLAAFAAGHALWLAWRKLAQR
ncbi:hypothetical protein [Piscinibacter sp.]|jgi:hypothetical protein|uniref:hypothetical protein n=1 Tax=Piscinibacter sp. TaxID=1903157 RepID=UPI0035599C9E